MAAIRPAATVLLTSKSPIILGTSRQNYKLLMVKRSSKNRFMPSARGVVENSDGDQKWVKMCGWKGNTKELAFRIAAIREVFEEVNVLVSTLKFTKPDLLHPYSHWITPDVEKYRYDTKFFVASLPTEYINGSSGASASSNSPDNTFHQAAVDSAEVTSLSWFSPDEAIAAFRKVLFESSSIHLPPPTWITLELLSRVPKQDDLLSMCARRSFYTLSSSLTSKDTILPYLPLPLPDQSGGIVMALPGDEAYPDDVMVGKKGMLNRMTLKGAGDFDYQNSEVGILNSKL